MNTRKDNKNPKQVRQVITRKIARNKFKNRVGSNNIQEAWKTSQIKKYGFVEYIKMRFAKVSRNQREALRI